MNLQSLIAPLAIAHYPCLLILLSFPPYASHHCNCTSLTWNALLQSRGESSLHVHLFLWGTHPTQFSSVFGICLFFKRLYSKEGCGFPPKLLQGLSGAAVPQVTASSSFSSSSSFSFSSRWPRQCVQVKL